MDLLLSIALRNRKMNKTRPSVPTTCVSKNPREVLCTIDGSSAKNKAANKPTVFPPISLPKKYITKHERTPMKGGINEQNVIKSMFAPNSLNMS